ncbi:MAG: hypothetical protein ABJA89_00750 [Lapillicoccus sp.]
MLTRDAGRLEAALTGGPTDPRVDADVALARALRDLPAGVRPDPAFVVALRDQLLAEPVAGIRVQREPRPLPVRRPRTLVVGGRRARLAGIGVLAVLLAATVVGVAGRAALPGEPLYAARHLVDRAGVVLARTAQDRGGRLLDVAERHVDDAVTLGSRPESPAESLRTALTDGLAAVDEGRAILVEDFRGRTDPGSLVALSRFADRVLPRAAELDLTAHAEVRGDVAGFTGTVVRLRAEALSLLAGCPTCGAAADDARRQLAALDPGGSATAPSLLPSLPSLAPSATPTGTPAGPPTSSAPSAGPPAAQGPSVTAPVTRPGGSRGSSPAASPTSAAASTSPPPDGQVVTVPPLPVSPSLSVSLSPSLSASLSASLPVPVPTLPLLTSACVLGVCG